MLGSDKKLLHAYHVTFDSPEGQVVLADLRRRCPLLTESLSTANGVDVNRLLIEEGRRSVLVYIYKMLKRLPYDENRQTHVLNQGAEGEPNG